MSLFIEEIQNNCEIYQNQALRVLKQLEKLVLTLLIFYNYFFVWNWVMKKLLILGWFLISFSVFANNPTSNSSSNENHSDDIIHKVCLFHDRVYQVIPFGQGECDFVVPGNSHPNHNDIGVPGDPNCFSEFIRIRHRHR